MNTERTRNETVCRRLDFGDESDCTEENITNNMIREELRKDQAKFEEQYNFDVNNEVPLPGKYSFRYDENGYWIGTLNKTDDEKVKIYEESSEEDELDVTEAKTPASKGTNNDVMQHVKKRNGRNSDSDNVEVDKANVSKKLF